MRLYDAENQSFIWFKLQHNCSYGDWKLVFDKENLSFNRYLSGCLRFAWDELIWFSNSAVACANGIALVRITGYCNSILSTFSHASAALRSLDTSICTHLLYEPGRCSLALMCMGTCRLLYVTGQNHIEVTENWILNELLCTSKSVVGLHW